MVDRSSTAFSVGNCLPQVDQRDEVVLQISSLCFGSRSMSLYIDINMIPTLEVARDVVLVVDHLLDFVEELSE